MTFHRTHFFIALLACALSACVNQTVPDTTDTTAPTINLASNTSSLTSAGNLTLTATVSDDTGVSNVEFFKNGSSLGSVTQSPFSQTMSISMTDNGTLEFTATAKDAAGNSKTSEPVSVTVNISAPVQTDTTPPTITLTSSSTSITSAGNLTLTATATDNVGVTAVEFFKNGSSLGTLTQSPFNKVVPITAAENGTLGFTAKASDAAGNSMTSDPIQVGVNTKAVWPKQFGTSEYDIIETSTVDAAGNLFVAGTTSGAFSGFKNAGQYDAFVAKYTPDGKQAWLTQFGTVGSDDLRGIAVDSSGNVFVGGHTDGSFAGFTNLGANDLIVAKLDANGSTLWLKQFGTSGYGDSGQDIINALAIDRNSNVFVTGFTGGTFSGLTSAGSNDAFVAKFTTNGQQAWVKQFGTDGGEGGSGISEDANGNVIIVGDTGGTFNGLSNAGESDMFMAKFDTNGNRGWIKQFGTPNRDESASIAIDNGGNLIVAASTTGAFPGFTNAGSYDPFIAKFNANGQRIWIQQFGTNGDDRSSSVAVDGTGSLIVGGSTGGSFAGFTNAGDFYDVFLTKYDANGKRIWLKQYGTNVGDSISSVAVTAGNNIFASGFTDGAFAGFTKVGVNFDAFIDSFTPSGVQR